jgi:very-short-patch-repair endonuclease
MLALFKKQQKLLFAKKLRTNMTYTEKRLWKKLRANQLGFKCKRQVPIGPYIADFAFLALSIVIEVDGSIHDTYDQQQKDKTKDAYLKNRGFLVIRIPNNMVKNELDTVLATLKEICEYQVVKLG